MIANTSREMVDSMSDIVWAINPERDRLSDLIQRMRFFAEELLDARDISYQFIVPEHLRDIALGADVRARRIDMKCPARRAILRRKISSFESNRSGGRAPG